MLTHPTSERLTALGLAGMARALDEQRRAAPTFEAPGFKDRHGRGSTIVTSQLPVDHWHEASGDPTLADAILDRLVHNAHRLQLSGESMRRKAMKPLDPGLKP